MNVFVVVVVVVVKWHLSLSRLATNRNCSCAYMSLRHCSWELYWYWYLSAGSLRSLHLLLSLSPSLGQGLPDRPGLRLDEPLLHLHLLRLSSSLRLSLHLLSLRLNLLHLNLSLRPLSRAASRGPYLGHPQLHLPSLQRHSRRSPRHPFGLGARLGR